MGCSTSNTKRKGDRAQSVSVLVITPGTFLPRSRGSLSNNYTEIKTLGSGAFAEVKLCLYKPLNQYRAVKIIHKSGLHYQQIDPEYMLKEISVLVALDHPNILRCFEIFENNWKFYVSTEYCQGGELFDKIVQLKKFSEGQASEIFFQLMSAIAYCHEKKVIHRDLKPENILLDQNDGSLSIKVADFGSSCFLDKGRKLTGCFGSAYYVAPEVLSGLYNEKCDIWSSGVILYVLLTGKPPYSGKDDKTILYQVRNSPLSIDDQDFTDFSPEVVDLLKKMLTVDPNSRIAAIEAVGHPWIRSFRDQREHRNLSNSLKQLAKFSSNSKLKDAVYIFIATQLISHDEAKELKKDFNKIDKNGDGKITPNELMDQYVLTMNHEEAKTAVDNIMKEVDTNQNGEIDYIEFLTACMNYKKTLSKKNLEIAFKLFDKDANGEISLDEIKNILSAGRHFDDVVWKDLVGEVDLNGDGVIDIREFINMMIL